MTRRNLVVDVGLALLVLGLSLAMLAAGGFGDARPQARALDAIGVVLAMASALPLVGWRIAPLTAYAVMAGASLLLDGLGYPFDIRLVPSSACTPSVSPTAATRALGGVGSRC